MNIIDRIEQDEIKQRGQHFYDFRVGDQVKVHVRIKEGNKERIQIFEGVLIGQKRSGLRSTITVRKVSYGVGVERVFPVYAPVVEKIEFIRRGKVRRSKLYYLRKLRGKKARLQAIRMAPGFGELLVNQQEAQGREPEEAEAAAEPQENAAEDSE